MKKAYVLVLLFSLGLVLMQGSRFANGQNEAEPTLNPAELLDFEQDTQQQSEALKRLGVCKNPLNCKILDEKGRNTLRDLIAHSLTDAKGERDACRGLQIDELVKK